MQGPSQELPSCSPYIAFDKNNEKIIAKNIHQHLETHQEMNHKQHGFRYGRTCLSQLR